MTPQEQIEAALKAIEDYQHGPYTASDVFMVLHLETIARSLLFTQKAMGDLNDLPFNVARIGAEIFDQKPSEVKKIFTFMSSALWDEISREESKS